MKIIDFHNHFYPPEYLDAIGVPLVGGIKRLPVRFTPTAPTSR